MDSTENQEIETPDIGDSIRASTNTGNDAAQVWISGFVIAILAFLTYSHTLAIPFHGEDQRLFVDSNALQRIVTAPTALEEMPAAPLTLFGFALNQILLPATPRWLHLVSLALHLANAVLVYLLCRRLLGPSVPERIAMLAGMLFAVHPIAATSVSYLVGRSALQGTFFALFGAWCFLRSIDGPRVQYTAWAIAIAAYTAAVGSDFRFLLLPILLVAMNRIQGNTQNRDEARTALRLHLGAMGLFAAAIIGSQLGQGVMLLDQASGVFATSTRYTQYLLVGLVWPSHILFSDTGSAFSTTGTIALLTLIIAGVLLTARRSVPGLALLWCGLALVATAGAASFGGTATINQGYFALAGISMLLPWLLHKVPGEALVRLVGMGVAVIILALAVVTYQNLSLWRQPDLLWQRVAQSAPNDHLPWWHIGKLALHKAQFATSTEEQKTILAQAEIPLRQALERAPENAEIMARLGTVLRAVGKNDEAMALLKDALRRTPFNVAAARELSTIFDDKMRTAPTLDTLRASIDYLQGVSFNALPFETRARFALAESTLGNYDRSIALLTGIVDPATDSTLALRLKQDTEILNQERTLDATSKKQFSENPASIEGVITRARMHLTRRAPLRAFYFLDLALRTNPGHREAWALMAITRAQMNEFEGFVTEWGSAEGVNTTTWLNLVNQCASMSMWSAGVRYLQIAPNLPQDQPPNLIMAKIALNLGQSHVAAQLAQQAAALHADDPRPWLMLTDMAITANNMAAVRTTLNEAQKRGASQADLEKRNKAAGIDSSLPSRPERTVIR